MKILATNKNASRNFEILDKIEAGIVLVGCEVKSVSRANCSINEAYITILKGELFIVNMHVANYFEGNIQNLDPYRSRKLLVHKHELIKLSFNLHKERLTCIPLNIYWSKGKIKLTIAVARGKKIYDKRQDMRLKDDKHLMRRY